MTVIAPRADIKYPAYGDNQRQSDEKSAPTAVSAREHSSRSVMNHLLEESGSLSIAPASSFCIASASFAVTPSPTSKQSAFALP